LEVQIEGFKKNKIRFDKKKPSTDYKKRPEHTFDDWAQA
jgi:hypothetical protein